MQRDDCHKQEIVMKQTISLLVTLLFLCLTSLAQDATIEQYDIQVNCSSNRSMTIRKHIEVTIHNKKAEDMADFSTTLENGTISLSDFSGTISDSNGKVIKKIKKGDLIRSEYSSEFKTNDYRVLYSFTPSSFPIHVAYDWTETFTQRMTNFEGIAPLPGYNVNVREATYQLTVPEGMEVLYHKRNTDTEVHRESQNGKVIYTARMENLKAITSEPLAPRFSDIEPSIIFEPKEFNYYGSTASLSSWQSLGQWLWQLTEGRKAIPQSLANKIDQTIDRSAPRKEQIAQACQLLRKMTRYISIQLGIGGWQPEKAEVTATLGLGDCKALTCLMCGMLEHLGISSFPTILHMSRAHLIKDFPSFGQTNHMILCVPSVDTDTLWIECTDPSLPIGYRHSGLAGHDVLLCTPDGGKLTTIADNTPEDNLWYSEVKINPNPDCSTDICINSKICGEQYESLRSLSKIEQAEQRKALMKMYNLGQVEQNKQLNVHESEGMPQLNTEVQAHSTGYAVPSGTRMILPVNPVHKSHSTLPNVVDRKLPVQTTMNYEDRENITITIPEGYAVESMPKAITLESAVGKLTMTVAQEEREVKIHCSVQRTAHNLPSSSYPEVQNFVKQIHNAYNQKLVLKKI